MQDEENLVRPDSLEYFLWMASTFCNKINRKQHTVPHSYIVHMSWSLGSAQTDRYCKYSGDPEYWIEIRQSGEKGQERETKKQRKEIGEDFQST